MDAETRTQAEQRLADAAATLRLMDPRPPLRATLKQLRERQMDAFTRAVAHYEEQVLPRLAAEEPMAVWLEYVRFVGQLTANGRLTAIGDDGAATSFKPPLAPGTLVLFLPEDTTVPAFIAAQPQQPSAAQHASMQLLVEGKLSLG
jgi:hypothetical protein